MDYRSLPITPALGEYLLSVSLREPELLTKLRAETRKLPLAVWQVVPEQGQLMALLVRLIGARRCLEIGTFTGYSSLAVALALPPEGKLLCCDIDPTTTATAREYWQQAGVAHKIELRLAPANETLEALIADGASGSFDFAFIDADKENYDAYFESCLKLLRPGGLAAIDNVLWRGFVTDPHRHDSDTAAIRAFNRKLHHDERIDLSMLTIGDGMTLARKR